MLLVAAGYGVLATEAINFLFIRDVFTLTAKRPKFTAIWKSFAKFELELALIKKITDETQSKELKKHFKSKSQSTNYERILLLATEAGHQTRISTERQTKLWR